MMNNTISNSFFLILLIITGFLYSCKDDSYSEGKDKEDRVINDFLKTHSGYTKTDLGYYYKVNTVGDGATPTKNDMVIITYTAKYVENMRMFDTDSLSVAEEKLILPLTWAAIEGPLKTALTDVNAFYAKGICDRLLSMKEGGCDSVLCPGDMGIGFNTATLFNVKLLKVIKNNREFELDQISKYFVSIGNNLTKADSVGFGGTVSPLVSDSIGIYIYNQSEGTGNYAVTGDSVSIKYTFKLLPYSSGTYLNVPERIIENGSTIKIKLGYTSLIPGFSGAVRLMKAGGKATVVIPFHKGYGNQVIRNQLINIKQIVVPQFSTLIYDMEILTIKKNS